MTARDQFIRVAREADIPDDAGLCVEIGDRTIALFRVNGRVCAIDDECPHEGGSLSDGSLDGRCVTCPLHAWEFDLETGETDDEPDAGIAVHEVRIDNGDVLVRVCEGARAREAE